MPKEYDGLTFGPLTEADIEELKQIMTRAFNEDARIHLNEPTGGPEGYDDGTFLRKYAFDERTTSYKIAMDGKTVGSVILWINQETKIHYLGNIFIDTNIQNKGIGLRIWRFIEQEYPDAIKWCTDTPAFSSRNHHFYVNKCGFHVVRIEHPMDRYKGSFVLEKVIQ